MRTMMMRRSVIGKAPFWELGIPTCWSVSNAAKRQFVPRTVAGGVYPARQSGRRARRETTYPPDFAAILDRGRRRLHPHADQAGRATAGLRGGRFDNDLTERKR